MFRAHEPSSPRTLTRPAKSVSAIGPPAAAIGNADENAAVAQFPYRLDYRFAPLWLPMGVLPGRDGVSLSDDGRLRATFGLLRLETTVSNVEDTHITGPYRWWTAVGPRLSLSDDGLTFGTNSERGVCIHFRTRVRRVIGLRDHSALTVTVADTEGLVAAIAAARRRS